MKSRLTPASARLSAAPTAYSLIEILIVVAIVGLLAEVATVNLEQAHVRAKVARTKADLFTLSLALEVYCLDHNHYPEGTDLGACLTTPVAYVTDSQVTDPFLTYNSRIPNVLYRIYGYARLDSPDIRAGFLEPLFPDAATIYAFTRHHYLLAGRGPDGDLETMDPSAGYTFTMPSIFAAFLRMADGTYVYDPTNGVVSDGDIVRTQRGPVHGSFLN